MLIPFVTRPAQPMYCRFTPDVDDPCFSWPVSSSAPTVIRFRRDRRAAPSRPAAAYFRTWLIAASSSHDARFSSRCDLPGVLSPACSATDHPFRTGRSLARADTYFPDCSHVCVRAKHDRSRPIRTDRSRTALRAPYPGNSSRPCFICSHKLMISGRLPSFHSNLPCPSRLTRSEPNWRLRY